MTDTASPKPELVLHIGFHKTGTSTTQIALEKASTFPDASFLYPMAGRLKGWPFAHHDLVADIAARRMESLQAIKQEWSQKQAPKTVISCEDFSHLEFVHTLGPIRDYFPDHTIRVVAVLREHIDWLRSLYTEKVKRAQTRLTAMEFFSELHKKLFFAPVLKTARQLGFELELYNYRRLKIPNRLFQILTGTEMTFSLDDHYNKSLSPVATMALLKFYREVKFDDDDLPNVIHNAYVLDDKYRMGNAPFDFFNERDIEIMWAEFKGDRQEVNAFPSADGMPLIEDVVPEPKGPKYDLDRDSEIDLFRHFLRSPMQAA